MSGNSSATARAESTAKGASAKRPLDGVSKRDRPHQGLLKLNHAARLMGNKERSTDEIKGLLVQSMMEYFEATRTLPEGQTDKPAITDGAPLAAVVCVLSNEAFPEAVKLVRWFCSAHMLSLERLAIAMHDKAAEVASSEASAAKTEKARRVLRVLLAGFNSFITRSRSKLFSTMGHVKLLEQSVGHARGAVNCLARECSDRVVGIATARLRGVMAVACFTPLNVCPERQDPAWLSVLWRMGSRDVDKLLKCLSDKGKKNEASFLCTPGPCVEAVGMLRCVAMAVPRLYPKIATAFAGAVKCMDAASEGIWGGRPALVDATVRHALIACSAHLADRLGRTPDPIRLKAYRDLWIALGDCGIMQSGGYILDNDPPPNSAAARALAEISKACDDVSKAKSAAGGAAGGGASVTASASAPVERGVVTQKYSLPSSSSFPAPVHALDVAATRAPHNFASQSMPSDASTTTATGISADVGASAGAAAHRARRTEDGNRSSTTGAMDVSRAVAADGNGKGVGVGETSAACARKRPRSPPAPISTVPPPTASSSARRSANLEPILKVATAVAATTAVAAAANPRPLSEEGVTRPRRSALETRVAQQEQQAPAAQGTRIAQAVSTPAVLAQAPAPAPAPAASERSATYPPLRAAPAQTPAWKEGERYQVVLGESFDGRVGGDHRAVDGSGQYVHLKYDFVPARTNVDAPATLRQRPLRGADGKTDADSARWSAEMEYESRDPVNSRPVRFCGDAARAQDMECVLVFDGNQFVMDRVSVVGGLKNVQEDFAGPVRTTGGEDVIASMAKRRKQDKLKKEQKDKATQQKERRREEKRRAKEGGGGVEVEERGRRADDEKAEGVDSEATRSGGGKAGGDEKGRKADNSGVVVTSANRLSQPKKATSNESRSATGRGLSGDGSASRNRSS